VPVLFVAVTWKVYAVPFVNPDTVVEVAGGEPDTTTGVPAVEPTNGVTVYDVTGPPGAVHDTDADAFPPTAVTPVGAPGTTMGPSGVTVPEAADAAPVPAEFVASTVKVYGVPLKRLLTVAVVGAGVPDTIVAVPAVDPV